MQIHFVRSEPNPSIMFAHFRGIGSTRCYTSFCVSLIALIIWAACTLCYQWHCSVYHIFIPLDESPATTRTASKCCWGALDCYQYIIWTHSCSGIIVCWWSLNYPPRWISFCLDKPCMRHIVPLLFIIDIRFVIAAERLWVRISVTGSSRRSIVGYFGECAIEPSIRILWGSDEQVLGLVCRWCAFLNTDLCSSWYQCIRNQATLIVISSWGISEGVWGEYWIQNTLAASKLQQAVYQECLQCEHQSHDSDDISKLLSVKLDTEKVRTVCHQENLSPFLNLSIAALTSSQQEAASQHISSNRNRSYSGKKQSHPIRNHVEYRQRRTKEWYERRRLQIIRQTLHSTVGEKERRVRWRRKYAQMAQSALGMDTKPILYILVLDISIPSVSPQFGCKRESESVLNPLNRLTNDINIHSINGRAYWWQICEFASYEFVNVHVLVVTVSPL